MTDIEVIEIAAPQQVVLEYGAPDPLAGAEFVSVVGTWYGAADLDDAPTITTDASTGDLFTVVLGGDRVLADPVNLRHNQRVMWRLVQDDVGGRAITLGPIFNVVPTVTGPIELSTGPGVTDYLGAIYRADTHRLDVLAFGRGF